MVGFGDSKDASWSTAALIVQAEDWILDGFITEGVHVLGGGHECLEPLLQSSSLRTIRIELDLVILLKNTFLRSLATSLPHLETLSVEAHITTVLALNTEVAENAEVATLDGLLPLVERCPKLVHIDRCPPCFLPIIREKRRSATV